MPAMTDAQRQKKYRDKQRPPDLLTADEVSDKVHRFLCRYPAQVKAVDDFMIVLASKIRAPKAKPKDVVKVDEWPEGRRASMDYNEDADPNS